MSLSPGTRLGPYEIVSPLGAGGMGEVYRAKDTRLGREVAVKVLPPALTASEQALQRFEREARTISQLSHPHICALYDVGREGDTEYLVMELLEGQTLAERISRGLLPLDQALRFGAEIADALEKAHRQGIVHRDLKPGNVMLTSSGVKLLDFGLARVLESSSSAEMTALPTEMPLTEAGTVLGTVQYMAPEQLEGKDADARTDIFALGLVLYEMATGRTAFSGATRASLIGAILRDDPPPISREQPMSPRALDRVVATCLAKEPEERWQTARDVALQLEGIRQERSAAGPTVGVAAPRRRAPAILPWLIAAAAVGLAAFALLSGPRSAPRPRILRAAIPPPPGTTFDVVGANIGSATLSPDGRRLAFGARSPDGPPALWVRELDALEAQLVPGGEGALFPFWSPDSRSIGFFAKGKLKTVEASASPSIPRELADVAEPRGGTWGEDGTILYAPDNFSPIMRVPAAGGSPSAVTKFDRASGETSHRWPHFLPGGKRFIYAIRKADPKSRLQLSYTTFAGSLDGSLRRPVLSDNTSALYAPPGYLLFRRAGDLMAVGFDPTTLAVTGEPVLLAKDIQGFAATGSSVASASADLLVYSTLVGATDARAVWLDRSGRELATVGPPGRIINVALDPGGRFAALTRADDPLPPDLWIFDTADARGLRLTRDTVPQLSPVFSPDGLRLFFCQYADGPWNIFEVPAHGGGEPKLFLRSSSNTVPSSVSPDGRYLMYREFNPGTRGDLKFVSLTGERQPRTFLASVDDESNADFSPDGHWVAYASDESGRQEIYVASFPDPTRRLRVSSEGGSQPRWSRDGKELYYVRGGWLLAAPISRQGDSLTFGGGQALFRLPLFSTSDVGFDVVTRYAVASDGRFLALLRAGDDPPTPLVLVFNWTEAMKKTP